MNVNFRDCFGNYAEKELFSASKFKLSHMFPHISKALLLVVMGAMAIPTGVFAQVDVDGICYNQDDAVLLSELNLNRMVRKQLSDSLAARHSKVLMQNNNASSIKSSFRRNMVMERLESRKVDLDTIPAIIFIDALRPDTVTIKCDVARGKKLHASHR